MSETVISVEGVSKRYRIGVQDQADTFAGQLKNLVTYPIKNFKRIANLTKFNGEDDPSIFWALQDINFEVKQGEVLGIIGHNGAGKSTLLKILSRITEPTTGQIKIKGRVSALLEVGTGFHPELTGRDNVYMNGTILGMRKKEIDAKFDEIVAFSGVEKHIDTPVKFYSSGMRVRLAFSVAAHLEPEILIIDEVLAVGDAEFQRKCLGKMEDVSNKQGRTVLFVSHNMNAIRNICKSVLLLDAGIAVNNSDTETIIEQYLDVGVSSSKVELNMTDEKKAIIFKSIEISGNQENHLIGIDIENEVKVIIGVEQSSDHIYHINLFFKDASDNVVFVISSAPTQFKLGTYTIKFLIPEKFLNDIQYVIDIMLVEDQSQSILIIKDKFRLEGIAPRKEFGWMGKHPGVIRPNFIESITLHTNNEE